ncbi:MAG: hypothetical protein LBS35_00230 [Synergistaceae bacterium]|jgi:hypothetical protein|nr:hypothetical protein [Synergistaceae bacterium]
MAYDLLTKISQNAEERARFRARRKFEMDMQHDRIVSFEEGETKGRVEESEKWQKVVEQKDAALAKTLGILADKDAEITRLRELLGKDK